MSGGDKSTGGWMKINGMISEHVVGGDWYLSFFLWAPSSVPVIVWFEWACLVEAQIFGLVLGELSQVGIKCGQM